MLGLVTLPLGSTSQHCRQATTTLPYINPKALGLLDSRLFLRNESGVQESSAFDRGFFSSASIVARHWNADTQHSILVGFIHFPVSSHFDASLRMLSARSWGKRPLRLPAR